MVQPCSITYLHALFLEISSARSFTFLGTTNSIMISEQAQRLDFIAYEMNRLLSNTKLFPSPAVQARFILLSFSLDSAYNFLRTCKEHLVTQEANNMHEKSVALTKSPHVQKQPQTWDDFLLPSSVESQTDCTNNTTTLETCRILTNSALKIVCDMERSEQSVVLHQARRDAQNFSPSVQALQQLNHMHGTSQLQTQPALASQKSINIGSTSELVLVSPTVKKLVQHRFERVTISPNPFSAHLVLKLDTTNPHAKGVEKLSRILFRMERRGARMTTPIASYSAPNAFQFLRLRTRHIYIE